MAVKGMAVFTAGGEDFNVNDPNIAEEFSSSTAYSKGNLVNYQGSLYRFTQNHAAGAWSAGDVELAMLGGIVENNTNRLDAVNKVVGPMNLAEYYPYTDNTYIRTQDGGARDNESFRAILDFIPASAGDVITQKNAPTYYYTESKIFIDAFVDDGEYIAPANTAFMRICWNKSYTPEVYKRGANGYDCLFDGNGAEFVDESIPGAAVKDYSQNVSIMESLVNARDIVAEKFTNGAYIRTQDGGARNNDNFKTTLEYIDITGMTQILLTNNEYAVYYNAETTFISSGDVLDEIRWESVPAGAKYIRVTALASADDAHVYAKDSSGNMYTEFNPKEVLNFRNKSIPFSAVDAEGTPATLPPDVKMVAPSGGDYTSIIEANARCDGSYSIVVLPGEYEGGWQAGDDTYGNKSTKKSYIGLDRNDCKAVRYGAAYAEDVFHTNGKTYMKNLALMAKKSAGATTCGYALHLDNGWLINGKAVFEDCYFSSEGRAAAGIGTRPNCDIIFRNCIFESDGNNSGAVFFHNDPALTEGGNQRLTFENCIFHSTNGYALYIGELGPDTNEIVLTMINCTLYSDTLGAGDDIVHIDKESYTGSGNGNVTLTARSHGNNIDIGAILAGE